MTTIDPRVAAAIITACSSIVVAVVVYIFNRYGKNRDERRNADLSRVGRQLRDLYGPLFALVQVNERIWEALRSDFLPSEFNRQNYEQLGAPESEQWRRWLHGGLLPTSRRSRDLILMSADLIIETEMPEPVMDFCAHVSALEVAVSEEPITDPLIAHPGDAYVSYVKKSYLELKATQERLLRRSRRRRTKAAR